MSLPQAPTCRLGAPAPRAASPPYPDSWRRSFAPVASIAHVEWQLTWRGSSQIDLYVSHLTRLPHLTSYYFTRPLGSWLLPGIPYTFSQLDSPWSPCLESPHFPIEILPARRSAVASQSLPVLPEVSLRCLSTPLVMLDEMPHLSPWCIGPRGLGVEDARAALQWRVSHRAGSWVSLWSQC